jgi:vacuolar-type H+-ATPase subunit E/Vma4
MTAPSLLDELRRSADEEIAGLWRKVRADAEAYRAELAESANVERKRIAQELSAKAAVFERAAAAEAERAARTTRAAAKVALAGRLYALAVEALPKARDDDYARRFAALAAELPPSAWQQVTVNPADHDLARLNFPRSEIVTDSNIAGGMNVQREDGRVRVSNTLESRLSTAWPEILPTLMNEILEEYDHS